MKKLAALLVSFTIITGTQSVVAEELSAEEQIKQLEALGFQVESEEEAAERELLEEITSALIETVKETYFEGTVACFIKDSNLGPFVYEITKSEIISKTDTGKIRDRSKITYRSIDWVVATKPHYTMHFTATEERYKSERQVANPSVTTPSMDFAIWGQEEEPNAEKEPFYYLWFETEAFNTKSLEMRYSQHKVVGGDKAERDRLVRIDHKCVILP